MAIELGDAVGLARALVRADSRNPSLVAGGPGEGEAARVLAAVLQGWGFAVALEEVAPGRPNVVARIGEGTGRSLLLNGHLDIVGVEGMTHAPFAGEERDGRLYGRGATDMKGGIAAMCAAAARAAADAGLAGEVTIAAVVDEEFESAGTRTLIDRGMRADAAIVTEPTRLAIAPAHRGFVWLEVTVHGRAAHGSRYDLGVDAIAHAGLLLAELEAFQGEVLVGRTHPLLGHASLHASTIHGGVAWSVYPEQCVLRLERRTLPGENADGVLREVQAACERVQARRPSFTANPALSFAQGPSDVAPDAPVVRALTAAMDECGETVHVEGLSAWTDAALLNAAGIPAICFGPGDISLAHAAAEWVEVEEIRRAARVLERLIRRWCGDGGGT